jgi:hypothetical protein
MDFCHAAAAVRSRLLQLSGDAKRMVRIYCVLIIFQLFHSPFFQLNCYFRGYRAIYDIAAHRWIFATPPPPSARVRQLKAELQKEW